MGNTSKANVKAQVLADNLRNWFNDNCCVIDFKLVCKMAGVHPPKDLEDTVRTYHCKSWADIPEVVRDAIQADVIALFAAGPLFELDMLDKLSGEEPVESNSFDALAIAVADEIEERKRNRPNFFQRWLGGNDPSGRTLNP